MKKRRFTEQQILGFLKEAEAGMPVKELCRKRIRLQQHRNVKAGDAVVRDLHSRSKPWRSAGRRPGSCQTTRSCFAM
jgi:hypothetical protein